MREFEDLEERGARSDMARVETAVEADLADLGWSATQLADLVQILFDGQTASTDAGGSNDRLNASSGLIASLLGSGEVDVVFMGATGGGNWTGWTIDPAGFPLGLENALQNASSDLVAAVAGSPLGQASGPGSTGVLLRLGDTAYLGGARGLLAFPAGNGTAWTIAALRVADDEYAAHLSDITGLHVKVEPADTAGPFRIDRTPRGPWVASTVLGGDVLQIQVTEARDIFNQGMIALLFVVGGAAALSALFLTVGLVLVQRLVTGRIERFAHNVATVRTQGNRGARVAVPGSDELADLAREFDRMLIDLERRTLDLTRSNDDLGAFASVVSHDLKSPLSTFNMNLAIMRRKADRDGDEKQRERVARMERTVQTMQGRIEAVLDYSKAGRSPALSVVPLGDVARAVLEDVEAHLVETKARVDLGPLPSVRGDRQMMAQALQNLLQNALKYRRPDHPPHIQIRAEARDRGWAVLVQDDGRGFDPADAERMLQPFQRLQGGLDQPGHGVGLATCARIMEVHTGRLSAQGTLGAGATMTLWFPPERVLTPPSTDQTTPADGPRQPVRKDAARAPAMEREAPERARRA